MVPIEQAPLHGDLRLAEAGCTLAGCTLGAGTGTGMVLTSTPMLPGNAGGGGGSVSQDWFRAARFLITSI